MTTECCRSGDQSNQTTALSTAKLAESAALSPFSFTFFIIIFPACFYHSLLRKTVQSIQSEISVARAVKFFRQPSVFILFKVFRNPYLIELFFTTFLFFSIDNDYLLIETSA